MIILKFSTLLWIGSRNFTERTSAYAPYSLVSRAAVAVSIVFCHIYSSIACMLNIVISCSTTSWPPPKSTTVTVAWTSLSIVSLRSYLRNWPSNSIAAKPLSLHWIWVETEQYQCDQTAIGDYRTQSLGLSPRHFLAHTRGNVTRAAATQKPAVPAETAI